MNKMYEQADLCSLNDLSLSLPKLSQDGQQLLLMLQQHLAQTEDRHQAIYFDGLSVSSNLLLPEKSNDWLSRNQVGVVVCEGDLSIDGDLINDDDGKGKLFLVVTGNLRLRSWWRGGSISFIGGDVSATGCLVGEYNDSALFVGGDLKAEGGYVHRRQPYPDMPDIIPHQVSGTIDAKTFDASRDNISRKELENTFSPEVLEVDEGSVWYDPWRMVDRCAQGLSIWRD